MMSQRVRLDGKVKGIHSEAEAKASMISATKSSGLDTKPSELSMARLKQG